MQFELKAKKKKNNIILGLFHLLFIPPVHWAQLRWQRNTSATSQGMNSSSVMVNTHPAIKVFKIILNSLLYESGLISLICRLQYSQCMEMMMALQLDQKMALSFCGIRISNQSLNWISSILPLVTKVPSYLYTKMQ